MDPPGHTVFLHLQELNRSELQAQAKLYGIKANQKSEVLRQQLQEILAARGNVNSPAPSVAVLEEAEEEEARDDEDAQKKDDEEQEENEENEPVDVKEDTEEEAMAPTVEEKGEDEEEVEQPTNTTIEEADEKKEEARVDDDVVAMKTEDVEEAVAPTVEEEEELLEQPTSSTDIEVNENEDQIEVAVAQQEKDHEESTTVNEMESKHGSSAWVEAEDDKEEEEEENTVEDAKKELPQSDNVEQEETENEESNAAPPLLVIVDLGSDEMADLADESIVSPTAAAKEMFRSKIPSGPSSSSGRRKALEERSINATSKNYTSKLGRPTTLKNVSMIIRNKNSPMRRPSSKIPRKPILETKTCPRPQAMPLSRRNEMQLQKFVERQNRGRKNREEKLKRAEFANLVRSPGKA
ncbi:unnamed protein product [Cylindrotheca closterium]|uniref:Uncharacterized protein n=1 Tax=Cylindrotheca closterium TaxID=2856 RepID=A0AAD2JJ15_9STRA|nr:unnamed protein product [Cylindrotheca closterium]